MYPFLFRALDKDLWVVKIADMFDYVEYNSSWMRDETLGPRCLVPDVDLSKEQHVFVFERDALLFIKKWWSEHDVERQEI